MKRGWALFLSGKGSTAQALMDLDGDLDLRLVVSSKVGAYGLTRARRLGIPTLVLDSKIDWQELDRELRRRGVSRLFLVGFMRLLPKEFVDSWSGRIWNVHPSLLPAYPGARALEKSFQEGAELGVTIHEVNAEMDAGTRVLQAKIETSPSWDLVCERVARTEQRLLREAAGRLEMRGVL